MDVRCNGKKHAVIIASAPDGVIEIKCDSRICGAGKGRVVLHRFDTGSGALLGTRSFKTPERN